MTTAHIYAMLPECEERGCQWEMTFVLQSMRSVYQHGLNPEAVCYIDALSCARDPSGEVRAKLQEFARRCHEYEDATQFDVQDD